MKRNQKKKIILAVVIVAIIIVLITVYCIATKKSPIGLGEENQEEYNLDLTNKYAENDNVKISIENVAYDGKNLILKYDIKSKQDEIFKDLSPDEIHLDRKIKLNSETVKVNNDNSNQVVEKKSDTESEIYDIVEVENVPDKFEIEVRFFENDLTVSGETESDPSEEEANDEDLEEYESEYDEDSNTETEEGVNDPSDEENDDLDENTALSDPGMLEEDATQDDYEEVEAEYNGEQTEEEKNEIKAEEKENDEAETERIGSVTFKGTKEEIQKGVENLEIAEQYEENNVKIESGSIIKTPFKTFLLFDTTISNVKYSQINNGESGDPSAYRINIEDSNNQQTDISESQEIKIENEDGTTENIEDSDNLVARVKTRIVLKTNESKELKIQPNYYINPIESTETSNENIGEGFQIEI